MEIIKNIDPLLEKQPEKRFAELLSIPVHSEKPVDFGKRKKRKNETAFYSIKTPIFWHKIMPKQLKRKIWKNS